MRGVGQRARGVAAAHLVGRSARTSCLAERVVDRQDRRRAPRTRPSASRAARRACVDASRGDREQRLAGVFDLGGRRTSDRRAMHRTDVVDAGHVGSPSAPRPRPALCAPAPDPCARSRRCARVARGRCRVDVQHARGLRHDRRCRRPRRLTCLWALSCGNCRWQRRLAIAVSATWLTIEAPSTRRRGGRRARLDWNFGQQILRGQQRGTPALARMSVIGAKSSASAARPASMLVSVQAFPVSARSQASARFGVGAMPP